MMGFARALAIRISISGFLFRFGADALRLTLGCGQFRLDPVLLPRGDQRFITLRRQIMDWKIVMHGA
ncbi:hypothetical protein XH79_38910 [Bradyrhizobium sp. CCBAU 45389]|nr:hypothetical protein [Bradyrhizobium sp. CCBAU 45389]